jgi:hypothetical protein
VTDISAIFYPQIFFVGVYVLCSKKFARDGGSAGTENIFENKKFLKLW